MKPIVWTTIGIVLLIGGTAWLLASPWAVIAGGTFMVAVSLAVAKGLEL